MNIRHASVQGFVVACLVSTMLLPGLAQNTSSGTESVPHAAQLINVTGCHPALNLQQMGGYGGYASGWYGGRWGDPWGYRYYQPPVTTANPQLGIHYTNVSSKTMSEIQFGLIVNNRVVAEVRDVGSFSPNAEIKHKFGLSPNVFPLQTGLPKCTPLRITFQDGTTWKNPRLPHKRTDEYYDT